MALRKYIALSNPMHQKKQKKFARQLKEKCVLRSNRNFFSFWKSRLECRKESSSRWSNLSWSWNCNNSNSGAAGVIAAGAFSGALIGGGTGAVLGGLSSAANGDGFIQGAADGFLWGTIGGAISGGVGAATGSLASSSASSIMKNPLAKSALENAADTTVGTIDDLAHGRR